MVSPLVECVPNISEGRNLGLINRIVDAVRAIEGCTVLGVEPDHDYNRTVITFAGSPQAVEHGAVALINASIELLDMRQHSGEHPRMGVVDVCPFVPLNDVTMETCAEIARTVVQRVAADHEVPLFLYGAAASSTERTMLSALRNSRKKPYAFTLVRLPAQLPTKPLVARLRAATLKAMRRRLC